MNKTKEVLVTGFALFSMFFGAGNLILPPFLGFKANADWFLVSLGFAVTAVVIPILGILAHAKLQGTMYDFGVKVSSKFSFVYCLIVYAIVIALPAPRTAAVTHEMAIAPFFDISSLWTSSIYFFLVFIFTINRAKILDVMGEWLTPIIMVILLAVIGIAIFSPPHPQGNAAFETPFIAGLLEGYQTFDAIAALVVGGVLIVSINLKRPASFEYNKKLIAKAGWVAGIGLLVVYGGLIYSGAFFSTLFEENATRTQVLSGLSKLTLGNIGNVFLSVLVALACFTTAVGIVTGTADYMKAVFKNSQKAFVVTALLGSLLGVLIGQLDVNYIIDIALPTLMFIYPITVALIMLNILPQKYAAPSVFKAVVIVTFIFSVPDFLQYFTPEGSLTEIQAIIPFAEYNMGWVLPALITFGAVNMIKKPVVKS